MCVFYLIFLVKVITLKTEADFIMEKQIVQFNKLLKGYFLNKY